MKLLVRAGITLSTVVLISERRVSLFIAVFDVVEKPPASQLTSVCACVCARVCVRECAGAMDYFVYVCLRACV